MSNTGSEKGTGTVGAEHGDGHIGTAAPLSVTTATTTTTKKKFGKNLSKLVKPPSSVTSASLSSNATNASSSSFIAKKNEGASSTGGGLLLLSTKRNTTTATSSTLGSKTATGASAASSLAVTVPGTTAASVAATGSTSSALLAKLSGGMALSAKGAAAHKAATASSTATTTVTPSSAYHQAVGPRPLNTPSLKSLVGTSSVGEATAGTTSTTGWKKTPAPPMPSPISLDDNKANDPKDKGGGSDVATPSSSSRVWKLGNSNTDAAAVLLPAATAAAKESKQRFSTVGTRAPARQMSSNKNLATRVSSSTEAMVSPKGRESAPCERATSAPDSSGNVAVSRIAVIREARRRQSTQEEPPHSPSATSISATPSGSVYHQQPIQTQLQPAASLAPTILKNTSPAAAISSTPIPKLTSAAAKPQVPLEPLGKPKSKGRTSEAKLVFLGRDNGSSGKGSASSKNKQKGDGKGSTSASGAGRSYSSLLGGSSNVKIEDEATKEGDGTGSHYPEEKRLGPPQRGNLGRLYNPHGEKDAHLSSSSMEENHFLGPGSRDRCTGGRHPRASSPPNNNVSNRSTNPTNNGTGAGMIHLSGYDDINRGERSSTAPRMLFDPKSGSMVEARQPQLQPPADFRGSKGGRGGKATKGCDRDRIAPGSGGGPDGGKKGSKNERKERIGRNRRDSSGADDPQHGDVVSAKGCKTGLRKPRAGSTGSKGDDSSADGPSHHPKKAGGRNAGNSKTVAKKQDFLSKQALSQARGGGRGRKDDRDASEDAGIETKRRGGRSSHQTLDQLDSKHSTIRDNKPLRGSPTKTNGESRNSRAGGLRSPIGSVAPGRDGRRGAGRGGGRSSTTEMGGRRGRQSSYGQQSRHNISQNGHSPHHSRFADVPANARHSQTTPEQPSKPSLFFDSGGLSLPEVAPQFNDDDFKVITDITDSVPAGIASTDNAGSLPIKASTASANAWQPSEAALAFAAVAAVKSPSKDEQDLNVHGRDAYDDNDDDDDLLNVPFLGLGFDPTRDMDAVMSSPSRQSKAVPSLGDKAVPALESLNLGPSEHSTICSAGGSGGTTNNSNPFATVGSPGSQFLGSSTWGGGRTLQTSNNAAPGGTSGSNVGLNLNWNSILGGGVDVTALNGNSAANSANGWGSSAMRNRTLGGSIMLDQDAKD